MKDKQVGELWAEAQTKQFGWASRQDVMELIRKLVEERARWHSRVHAVAKWHVNDDNNQALRDFGIDPETWKETK